MNVRRVDLAGLSWSGEPGVDEVIVTRQHHSGHPLELPVARITGEKPGPTFTVMSGMHAGEYAGILAAQRLITQVKAADLSGALIVIPVISTAAFMLRNMQLNPYDEREIHFILPGNPEGTYSDCLVDTLWEVVKDSNYVIDSHAGEMAQALYPWVPIPMIGDEETQRKSYELALGFEVPGIEPRSNRNSIPPLCIAFSEAGIANVWVEVGKQGVPTERDISIHFNGYVASLQTAGMLPGKPARPKQEVLHGERYGVNSTKSGVWHPAVTEGQLVENGQLLGTLTDYFGNVLEEFHAPRRSQVFYYWSSPAINAERTPHGYQWHNALVSLLALE